MQHTDVVECKNTDVVEEKTTDVVECKNTMLYTAKHRCCRMQKNMTQNAKTKNIPQNATKTKTKNEAML